MWCQDPAKTKLIWVGFVKERNTVKHIDGLAQDYSNLSTNADSVS